MPDCAARLSPGHCNKGFRPIQSNRLMAQVVKDCKVTTWATAKVEDGIRAVSRYMSEQGGSILTDIMVLRPALERFRTLFIESESRAGGLRDFFRAKLFKLVWLV